jgi:hypothetical protein
MNRNIKINMINIVKISKTIISIKDGLVGYVTNVEEQD